MTDYTKMVEALRKVADYINCYDCDMWGLGECDTERKSCVLHNAADAIEELQQIAEHHEQTAKDYWKEACEYKAQLPKRGEWHTELYDGDKKYQCSNCLTHWDVETRYCPFCGAKMEVQDAERNEIC